MHNLFKADSLVASKYLLFTGKGGVGKTSIACAIAVALADSGKKILLISTDPASNLQDVFATALNGSPTQIKDVPGLYVVNLDPVDAAASYRKSVVDPYRGKLPDAVLANMEEQLSGSCTVEIAAFNEFTNFLTNKKISAMYDHILFDTAPTGHTLRMLQLPSAWTDFISESTHGASCLGQLSGLEDRKDSYSEAVQTLSNGSLTTLVLIARPEKVPLLEAERASAELSELGVHNQILIVNGVFQNHTNDDSVSESLYRKQQGALKNIPGGLKETALFYVPLRSYNMTGVDNIRMLLVKDNKNSGGAQLANIKPPSLQALVDDLYNSGKKVIFAMGKGGVGKTTVAAAIAKGLAAKGIRVHLTTTDPANHTDNLLKSSQGITMSRIDEQEELEKYQEEVLVKARETMGEDDLAYIEEDLRSPCTQEIAVFRAFAEIVDKADDQVVVIDTAPTGHTLLLLDATRSYHKEVQRTQGGNIPQSVQKLLPRLRNSMETEVVIVTLPETTPVYEAERLEKDLARAGIAVKWWVINSSMYLTDTDSEFLRSKAMNEVEWINRVAKHTDGKYAVIPWIAEDIKNETLFAVLGKV